MPVVLVLLMVLLGLLLVVLLVAVLLLSVRTGVEAVGVNGEVSVELRYGMVRIPIWPPPRHRKEKAGETPPSGEKKSKKKKRRKQKKYRYSLNRDALDVWEIADLVLRLLSELASTLRISRLRVRVLIGTDDAAKTGVALGTSAALVGMIVPFLENTFDMREYHVDVDADFEADHTDWAFTVFCSLRPLRVLLCMLRHSGELFRMYKRLIKKEEAINHE